MITIFRDYNTVQFQSALPLETLDLDPRLLLSFRLLRDYKPKALQTLVRSGVVRMNAEGTYYLSEETLNSNREIKSVCYIKRIYFQIAKGQALLLHYFYNINYRPSRAG